MKAKTKKKLNYDLIKKVIKITAIICVSIIVIEVMYLIFAYWRNESKNTYYNVVNAIEKVDDGYVVVGNSDFKHSKGNSYTKGYTKGKLALYTEDHQLLWEKKYEKGYNTTFNDVAVVEDGYIAVGSGQMSEEQAQDEVNDAIIVKFDKEGNVVFENQFQILGDSKFTKVKVVESGIYVVGQSILEPMVLGLQTNGGGVLVKYDFEGKEIFHSNFGGGKSGLFNDFVISSDGIYVVGKDATNTGLIVKYTMDGDREWIRNYSYTDTLGFSSVIEYNGELYIVGSTKVKEDKDDYDIDGLLVKYDKTGRLLMEKKFTVNERVEDENKVIDTSVSMDRFNDLVIDQDQNLVIVGQTTVKDVKESTKNLNVFRYNGLFLKYSLDGELLEHKELGGSRDDYLSEIMLEDDHYLIVGTSNSKDQDLKQTGGNGKDYKPWIINADKEGNIIK